jgi:hypothetical protein
VQVGRDLRFEPFLELIKEGVGVWHLADACRGLQAVVESSERSLYKMARGEMATIDMNSGSSGNHCATRGLNETTDTRPRFTSFGWTKDHDVAFLKHAR